MNGYVIEFHATFAFKGNDIQDTINRIFDEIDLNNEEWNYTVLEEMTEEEFDDEFY